MLHLSQKTPKQYLALQLMPSTQSTPKKKNCSSAEDLLSNHVESLFSVFILAWNFSEQTIVQSRSINNSAIPNNFWHVSTALTCPKLTWTKGELKNRFISAKLSLPWKPLTQTKKRFPSFVEDPSMRSPKAPIYLESNHRTSWPPRFRLGPPSPGARMAKTNFIHELHLIIWVWEWRCH